MKRTFSSWAGVKISLPAPGERGPPLRLPLYTTRDTGELKAERGAEPGPGPQLGPGPGGAHLAMAVGSAGLGGARRGCGRKERAARPG